MDDLGCIDEDTRVSIATPPEFSFNVTVFVKSVFGMHRWKAPGLSGHLLSLSFRCGYIPNSNRGPWSDTIQLDVGSGIPDSVMAANSTAIGSIVLSP